MKNNCNYTDLPDGPGIRSNLLMTSDVPSKAMCWTVAESLPAFSGIFEARVASVRVASGLSLFRRLPSRDLPSKLVSDSRAT